MITHPFKVLDNDIIKNMRNLIAHNVKREQ